MKTTNVMEEKSKEHVGTDECHPVKKKLKQAQLSQFKILSQTNKKKRKLTEVGKRSSREIIVLNEDTEDNDEVEAVEKKPKICDETIKLQTDNENVIKNKSETDVSSCENECNKKVTNKEEKENKPNNEYSDEDKKIHKVPSGSSKVQCKSDGSGEQNHINSMNEEKSITSNVIGLTTSPLGNRKHEKVSEQVEKSLKTPDRKKRLSPRTPTSSSTKVRKLTPKQLQRQQALEKKREEKERLKQEKEKVREEREKLREQQKQERIRLKNEKEDLKRREKEEKERKRLAELEQKNEEKRIKEEERKAKEEERKAKEEERKAKEEEKRKKEEEKMAVNLKEAKAFASYFVPKRVETKYTVPEIAEENEPVVKKFIPFEVKLDMRVAPVTRVTLSEQSKLKLDEYINAQNEEVNCDSLYLNTLKSADYVPGYSAKTWPVINDNVDEDDIIIIESEKVEGNEQIENKENKEEKKQGKHSKRVRAKLLQFTENRRPPYWGTWRKKSQHIRPRAPFSQDKAIFEYEVDSDDEWEEVEDGESLRASDDEESQDESYEEDNEMFVPHGYLSDEEGQDEVDDTSPETQKLKLKYLQMEFEAERNEKQERIKPRLIGCVWFKNSDGDHEKVGSHIAELLLSRRAVFDGELPIVLCVDTCPPSPDSSSPLQEASSSGPKKRVVPETAVPMVIKLLHGNTYNRKFISNELCAQFKKQALKPLPSHNCVGDKIREIAEWMVCPSSEGPPLAGKKCWYVKEDVRKQFGLTDLNANSCSEWSYICEVPKQIPATTREQPSPQTPSHISITKFTKVLSTEERKRLLLVNMTDNAVTPEKVSNQKTCMSSSPPSLTGNKTATPVVKQKKRATLITVGPVQGTSKQIKNSSPSLTGNKIVTPVVKQKKRATGITVSPIQGTPKQLKNSSLHQFIKSPNTTGCDKKNSEANSKDINKRKCKTDISSRKTKDDECIVLSD